MISATIRQQKQAGILQVGDVLHTEQYGDCAICQVQKDGAMYCLSHNDDTVMIDPSLISSSEKHTFYSVNASGMREISTHLLRNHIRGADLHDSRECLEAWAYEVEQRLSNGGNAGFYITSSHSKSKRKVFCVLSKNGFDKCEMFVDEFLE